jgi:hypothetical protein
MNGPSKIRRLLVMGVAGAAIAVCIILIAVPRQSEPATDTKSGQEMPPEVLADAKDINTPAPLESRDTKVVAASVGESAPVTPLPADANTMRDGMDLPGSAGWANEGAMGVEIAGLATLYLEESHLITELPPPDGPVPLRVRYGKKDEGTAYQKRSVLVEEYPFGMKTGRLIMTTGRVDDVDEAGGTAAITESYHTLVSAVQGETNAFLGDVSTDRSFKLSADGSTEMVKETWKNTGPAPARIRGDWDAMTTFPREALVLGQKQTLPMTSCVDTGATGLTKEPARLDIVVPRRVLFDGREAYEVQIEQYGYAQIDVQGVRLGSIQARFVGKGRYYVEASTGQILWRDAQYTIREATTEFLAGTKLHFREELAPVSSSQTR